MQKVNFLKSCHRLKPKEHLFQLRCCSSTFGRQDTESANEANEQIRFQNHMFEQEKKQIASKRVPRIEKIEVEYCSRGISSTATMFMNKNLSNSSNCALHVSKHVADQLVIAKVTPKVEHSSYLTLPSPGENITLLEDGSSHQPVASPSFYWDANRVLPFDCKVEFLNFQMSHYAENDMKEVNKAYWRSCAMVLGATLNKAFKDKYTIAMLPLPQVSVESGAFCYDIELDEKMADWKPSHENLVYMTKIARSVIADKTSFERLDVDVLFARKLFENDRYRLESMESSLPYDPVTLYRFGDFIDIADGPMISHSNHIFHYVVTAFHQLDSESLIRRVQGISLPQALKVHHSVWNMLENRARKLVTENIPIELTSSYESRLDLLKHKSIEDDVKIYTRSTGQWDPDMFHKEDKPITI